MATLKKKASSQKPAPVEPNPDWTRFVTFQYQLAFDSDKWRKVHPPHLEAALAAGGAAIQAYLESVRPFPYFVAEVASSGSYGQMLWLSNENAADGEE